MPRVDGDIVLTANMDTTDVINASDKLTRDIEKIFNKAGKRGDTSAGFQSILKQMDEAVLRAQKLRAAMADLEGTRVFTPEYTQLSNEFDELIKQHNKLSALSDKLKYAKGKGIYSQEYKDAQAELKKLNAEAQRLSTTMDSMRRNGSAFMNGEDTEEYRQLAEQLNQVNNQMVVLQQRAYESQNAVSSANKNAGSFSSTVSKLKKTLSSLASTTKRTLSHIGKLGSTFFSLRKNNDDLEKSFKRGIKTLIKYGFGVRSFFFLYRKMRKAVVEGFETLSQVHQPFNAAMSSMKTSLELLKNTLAASFAPIIETVAPIITKFLNMLAEAVASVGQFIAALTGKEYVRAAAVQVDYAESVQQGANSSKNATKATKEQTKASKELKKTLAGFDDVEILHEDKETEPTTTEDTTTDPSAIFSSMPIDNAISEFAKRFKAAWASLDLSDIGRKLGEKLLNALKNIPWNSIRKTLNNMATRIATFLNGFLSVPGLFTEIGKTLAEALNTGIGFLYTFITKFNWASLGTALKDGILGYLQNIDWALIYSTVYELGAGIGTALENAVDNPEIWIEILGFFSKRFNALLYAIAGFVTSLDWGSIATNIAIGLNEAVGTIDWNEIAYLLIFILNSAFEALYNFVTTFDFYKLGAHIGIAISTVLRETDWVKGGASVAAVINSLMLALDGFIVNTDWAELARSIIDIIAGFFGEFSWSTVGKLLSDGVIGLLDFLIGAFQQVDWLALPGYIVNAIGDFLSNVNWKDVAEKTGQLLGEAFKAAVQLGTPIWNAMIDFGENLIEGGWEGIKQKMTGVWQWLKDNVFTPFIEGFKSVFGISSPAKEMQPFGTYIVEGFFSGITDKFKSIVSWLRENVFDPFMSGIKNLFGLNGGESSLVSIGRDLIEGLKEGLSNKVSGMGSWIGDHVTGPICGFVKDLFGINSPSKVFAEYGKGLMEGMEEGIDNNSDLATKSLSTAQSGMLNVFSGFKEWVDMGGKLMSAGLILGIASQHPSLITMITNTDALMRGAMESNLSEWSATGASIINNIIEGISTASSNIGTVANTLVSYIGSAFNSQDWGGLGWNIGMGIYNGLSNAGGYLDTLAWNVAISMYNSACSALGIASPSKKFSWVGEMMTEGLRDGIVDNASNATNAVTDMVSDMTDVASSNNPEISINTAVNSWINDLDEVLTQFADTVTDKFDSLINTLNGLNTSYAVPAISAGHVIPSYASTSHTEADDRLNKVIDNLDYLSAQIVTRNELSDIITTVVQRYLNIDFYIGDEQLARHANAGNVKLQRRYSPTK